MMGFVDVFLKDFKNALCNITGMFVIVVGAFIYIILYPSPYRNDIVFKQDIAIIDLDKSALSREFAFDLNATRGVNIAYNLDSVMAAKRLMDEDKIYGYVIFPQGMQAKVLRDEPVTLSYAANSNYFLIYSSIVESIVDVNNNISAHIKAKRAITKGETPFLGAAIPYDIPMYNPSLGFINYALAAIFVVILHQTSIGGIAIITGTYNRRKEEDDKEGKEEYYTTYNPWLLALARYMIFFIIYLPIYMLYFGVGFYYYHVLVSSSLLNFALLAIAFHFACISYGLAIGSLISDVSKATQLVIFTSLPIVFCAGFIWPIALIPAYIMVVAKIVPAFWGINAFLRLNQMGATFHDILPYIIMLISMGIIALLVFISMQYRKTHN